MRSSLSSLGVASVMAACLVSGAAFATPTGIAGRSGKQGMGQTCTTCHSAGASAPTVALEGPSTLAPGATGNYKLIIRGGPGVRAGFNVAVDGSADAKLGAGEGSRLLNGEVTHSTPKAFANGESVFDFTLVAPPTEGTLTLYGAGNSVNFNQTVTGDSSALTQLSITVGKVNGGDDDKGCAAAGGAPLLGAVLMVLGARLRRRR